MVSRRGVKAKGLITTNGSRGVSPNNAAAVSVLSNDHGSAANVSIGPGGVRKSPRFNQAMQSPETDFYPTVHTENIEKAPQPFIDGLARLRKLENKDGVPNAETVGSPLSPTDMPRKSLVSSNIIAGLASSSVMPDGRK